MQVKAIKTAKVTSQSIPLTKLLDIYLEQFQEKQILAVTSKIIALCEGNIVPIDAVDKQELVAQQSSYYLPPQGKYGFRFNHAIQVGKSWSNCSSLWAMTCSHLFLRV